MLVLLCGAPACAQQLRVEVAVGLALNMPLPVVIAQQGEAPLRVRGRFDTRAFAQPIYYVARAGVHGANSSWALELIHHKLYLRDHPRGIERFQISHGFNVLNVLYGRRDERGIVYRAGAGVIVSHPENTVRGRMLPETGGLFGGYHLSGPAAQLAVGADTRLLEQLHAFAEAKLVGARASVPIAGGRASFWHLSGHAVAGPSHRF